MTSSPGSGRTVAHKSRPTRFSRLAACQAGGALVLALGLAGCSTLSGDLTFGTLDTTDAPRVEVTLGHLDDQNRYLVVCPGTTAKDLGTLLGVKAPADYPEEGYADKSAIAFLTFANQVSLRTWDTSKFNLCQNSTGWSVTDISQPLTMTKDESSGAWYASPAVKETSTSDTSSVGEVLPSLASTAPAEN